MAGNPNLLVCIAAPLVAIALLLTALSFATDNWITTTVDREKLIQIAHSLENNGKELNSTLYEHPNYVTRHRGLFRTCFDGSDAYCKYLYYYDNGPSINVNIFMSVQTIHFLRLPPPPQKKSTHQHFLSAAKNPHENY